MYNFLISLGGALVVGVISGIALGGFVYGIIPALLVAVGSYFLLLRRSIKQVEGLTADVTRIMTQAEKQSRAQARNQRAAQAVVQRSVDQAIVALRKGYLIGAWQWGIRSQMDAQIGNLLYTSRRFREAKPYLKTGFARLWTTRAMLGACHFQDGDFGAMRDAFDQAVRANKKQGMLYAVYAWCVLNAKDGRKAEERRDDALALLAKGSDVLDGKDINLSRNVDAVRNGKKMNLSGYGQQWYAFHLETPKQPRQQLRGR